MWNHIEYHIISVSTLGLWDDKATKESQNILQAWTKKPLINRYVILVGPLKGSSNIWQWKMSPNNFTLKMPLQDFKNW
jgi:hypothetical protein